MNQSKLWSYAICLAIGLGIAAWWSGVFGGKTVKEFQVANHELPGAMEQVDRQALPGIPIDFGDMTQFFRIKNPRVEERTDRQIAGRRSFKVLAFEVEAFTNTRASIFLAKCVDSDGVLLPEKYWPGPVMLDPDYSLQGDFEWKAGDRSHGWIMLPEQPTGPGTRRIAKIVIRYLRG